MARDLLPVRLLGSLVSERDLPIDLVSLPEFSLHLLKRGTVALGEPRVAYHVRDRWSVLRVVLQHHGDQALELVVQRPSCGLTCMNLVRSPERPCIVVHDQAVKFVRRCRHIEWRVACVEREDDHSNREKVRFDSFVGHALQDLWRHVTQGANISFIPTRPVSP